MNHLDHTLLKSTQHGAGKGQWGGQKKVEEEGILLHPLVHPPTNKQKHFKNAEI